MTNALQVFSNEDFGEIRVVDVNGEPWFVATDVCKALEISNVSMAVSRLDEDEKGISNIDTLGGKQGLTIVSEAGLYGLIMTSRKPEAKAFKRWIKHEVLPSIRKTGKYELPPRVEDVDLAEMAKVILSPEYVMKLCQMIMDSRAENEELKDKNERLKAIVDTQSVQIAELKPKVSYYDTILQSQEAIPISIIAKDYGMSGKEMNRLLRDMKIQYKIGKTWLVYQNYAQCGYTCTKTKIVEDNNSVTLTYWTQKGRLFLYEKLRRNGIIPLIEKEEDLGLFTPRPQAVSEYAR